MGRVGWAFAGVFTGLSVGLCVASAVFVLFHRFHSDLHTMSGSLRSEVARTHPDLLNTVLPLIDCSVERQLKQAAVVMHALDRESLALKLSAGVRECDLAMQTQSVVPVPADPPSAMGSNKTAPPTFSSDAPQLPPLTNNHHRDGTWQPVPTPVEPSAPFASPIPAEEQGTFEIVIPGAHSSSQP